MPSKKLRLHHLGWEDLRTPDYRLSNSVQSDTDAFSVSLEVVLYIADSSLKNDRDELPCCGRISRYLPLTSPACQTTTEHLRARMETPRVWRWRRASF